MSPAYSVPTERVSPLSPRPRPSTPADPTEWDITEDGFRFRKGDRVYNYLDGVWVTVLEDPSSAHLGWFKTTRGTLNCTRVFARVPEGDRR